MVSNGELLNASSFGSGADGLLPWFEACRQQGVQTAGATHGCQTLRICQTLPIFLSLTKDPTGRTPIPRLHLLFPGLYFYMVTG